MKVAAVLTGLTGTAFGLVEGFILSVFALAASNAGSFAGQNAGFYLQCSFLAVLIAACGLLASLEVALRPRRGAGLFTIAALAWSALAWWMLDGRLIYLVPCPVSFGVAAALAWRAHWRDRASPRPE